MRAAASAKKQEKALQRKQAASDDCGSACERRVRLSGLPAPPATDGTGQGRTRCLFRADSELHPLPNPIEQPPRCRTLVTACQLLASRRSPPAPASAHERRTLSPASEKSASKERGAAHERRNLASEPAQKSASKGQSSKGRTTPKPSRSPHSVTSSQKTTKLSSAMQMHGISIEKR